MKLREFVLSVLISLMVIILMIPIASSVEPEYQTGFDGIWIEEGPTFVGDMYHVKIGYTHYDRGSIMQIQIITSIMAGGTYGDYVHVIPYDPDYEFISPDGPSAWTVPYNGGSHPPFTGTPGYIDYYFYPTESTNYWNNEHGIWVNPTANFYVTMDSSTSGHQSIPEVPYPWEVYEWPF